ncbi:MAG: DUF2963 domain-containing protein [Phytoplasma sp.]|nr:DUF2963 domain-containing protein [Phytoplasma sp.]WRH06529.1 MAG: DUF2963 domain-containing protein [Phytoplasma sp.]
MNNKIIQENDVIKEYNCDDKLIKKIYYEKDGQTITYIEEYRAPKRPY